MRPSSLRLADFVKSASYCRDTVRKLDYPAHLCGYFYPKYALDDYYALKAWNIELATIKWETWLNCMLYTNRPAETALLRIS